MNRTSLSLKKRYSKLNADVRSALIKAISKSKVQSKHIIGNCIAVDINDYTELVYFNESLQFLDSSGYSYNLYNDCTIQDLIDILNQL